MEGRAPSPAVLDAGPERLAELVLRVPRGRPGLDGAGRTCHGRRRRLRGRAISTHRTHESRQSEEGDHLRKGFGQLGGEGREDRGGFSVVKPGEDRAKSAIEIVRENGRAVLKLTSAARSMRGYLTRQCISLPFLTAPTDTPRNWRTDYLCFESG
jgi:hypothetical protein